MKDELLAGDRTPGLESLHQLRLTALLRDVVKRKGRMEASVVLRVNYKTLASAIDSGKLTPRLYDALERLLLIRELAALEEVRALVGELEGRVKAVEDMAQTASVKVEELVGCQLGRPKWSRSRQRPTRSGASEWSNPGEKRQLRMLPLGTNQGRSAHRLVSCSGVRLPLWSPWSLNPVTRRSTDLRGPWWRSGAGCARAISPRPWPAWLVDEERLRALEIALIGEHELTLPPDTDPWDSLSRRTQVRWRTRTLERVRRERDRAQVRRWLRRVLTLGLWRK